MTRESKRRAGRLLADAQRIALDRTWPPQVAALVSFGFVAEAARTSPREYTSSEAAAVYERFEQRLQSYRGSRAAS
jgi:hypothetical protein